MGLVAFAGMQPRILVVRCDWRARSATHDLIVNVFTKIDRPSRRGRPSGRTAEGEATRSRLYKAAIALIGERGYEAATLRDVAARARVSPALLYKYFPNKRSVVLALYDELSEEFARQAAEIPRGKWRDRFMAAVETALRVLGPHRVTLRALAPIMVGDVEEGVFARSTAFSRVRVQAVFEQAVAGSTDAPQRSLAGAMGRLLYLAHLGIVLWWILDRSPGQRATTSLVALLRKMLPSVSLTLRLSPVRRFIQSADVLFKEALLDDPGTA
jgi:AcrR family transcriptional regulator